GVAERSIVDELLLQLPRPRGGECVVALRLGRGFRRPLEEGQIRIRRLRRPARGEVEEATQHQQHAAEQDRDGEDGRRVDQLVENARGCRRRRRELWLLLRLGRL